MLPALIFTGGDVYKHTFTPDRVLVTTQMISPKSAVVNQIGLIEVAHKSMDILQARLTLTRSPYPPAMVPWLVLCQLDTSKSHQRKADTLLYIASGLQTEA